MITGISIQNFKGIRGIEKSPGELKPLEIELRPLTLLFGPNSAGKSSILHALQYAAEVFERRNLDAGLIGNGAAGVDLGGFQNLVHGHNTNFDVTLGFRLAFPFPTSFPSLTSRVPRDVEDPDTLYGLPKTASAFLSIGWSNLLAAPFVRRYAVTIDETELAEIRYEPGSPDCQLLLNERHPIFVRNGHHSAIALWHPLEAEDLGEEPVIKQLLDWAGHCHAIEGLGHSEAPYTSSYGLLGADDALPDFSRPLSFDGDWDWIGNDPQLANARLSELSDYLTEAVSQVVLGPGRLVRDELLKSRFLGPIREVPQRSHVASRHQDRARWSTGLGAWDRLETADDAFINAVSNWLGDEDRLNSGYRLRLKQFKEVDLSDPLVTQLLSGRAFDDAEADSRLDLTKLPTHSRLLIVPTDDSIELRPSDVGIGISQVVPVIVTALDGFGRTISVEQPELHLHPKLQAELGDLFIESAKGKAGHVVILETHSELIPLRLMRRIKETFQKRQQRDRPGLAEEDVAIYYVAPFQGATVITRLKLSEDGQLLDPWPEGFFEEGYRGALRIEELPVLYHFAITPDAFEPSAIPPNSAEAVILIELLRGIANNGLLADLNAGAWLTKVTAQNDANSFPPELRDKLRACMKLLKDRNRLIRHPVGSARPDDDDLQWLHWAMERHLSDPAYPFAGIIATETYAEYSGINDAVLVALEKALDHAGWLDRNTTPRFPNTDIELKRRAMPLLRYARRVTIIDPYMTCRKDRFFNTVQRCADLLGKHDGQQQRGLIQIHAGDPLHHGDPADREPAKERLDRWEHELAGVIAQWKHKFEIWLWRNKPGGKDFHDRYIITDQGGVAAPGGLDFDDDAARANLTSWSWLESSVIPDILLREFNPSTSPYPASLCMPIATLVGCHSPRQRMARFSRPSATLFRVPRRLSEFAAKPYRSVKN